MNLPRNEGLSHFKTVIIYYLSLIFYFYVVEKVGCYLSSFKIII